VGGGLDFKGPTNLPKPFTGQSLCSFRPGPKRIRINRSAVWIKRLSPSLIQRWITESKTQIRPDSRTASEYLSDGITESIINSFSQLPKLRVVPRSAVFRYKGQQVDPQEIGRKLGVRAVLTGRVVQHGDKVNIQTELIDVDKDSQLWGEQYNRALADLQSVQAEISNQILARLRLRLTGEEQLQLSQKHTPPPAAYQAYLKGRYAFNQNTNESAQKALEYFNEAIRIDPNYALAYAGVAKVYTEISNRYMSPREAMPKAKDATLKALSLDTSLAEAHFALARIYWFTDWDFPAAEQEFKKTVELNPNDPSNYGEYGTFVACTLGRFDEGLAMENRALQLDSLSLVNRSDAAYLFDCARQYDRLIEEANKILELDPGSTSGHFWLGKAYLQKGLTQQALAELEKTIDIQSGSGSLGTIGYAYAIAGRRSEALKVIDQLKKLSERKYFSPYSTVLVYAGLGDKDHAFEWLEKAFAERNDNLPFLKTDPLLDKLRSDPRFNDLLRRVGLTP